jgi:DNA-binding MarR family transcriptional regulator
MSETGKTASGRRRDHRTTREIEEAWRRERPDLHLDDMLLELYLLRAGDLLARARGDRSMAWFGIVPQDLMVLWALRRAGQPYVLRPTDLFRSLAVSPAAITKQVARLLDDGFVRRTGDREHRGGFLIHLTAKGRKLADAAIERYSREPYFAKAFEAMSSRERAAGEKFLRRLLDELEADAGDYD